MTSIVLQTTQPHRSRVRRLARTTLFAAALAVAISPFGGLAVASADYNDGDFEACMNRNMPTDYCCEHAGGVMRSGACIDPATLRVQEGSGSTTTIRHPLPPGILAPPVIAVDPGVG
jgi:hypothetical protein